MACAYRTTSISSVLNFSLQLYCYMWKKMDQSVPIAFNRRLTKGYRLDQLHHEWPINHNKTKKSCPRLVVFVQTCNCRQRTWKSAPV